jgi:hypothetical protein
LKTPVLHCRITTVRSEKIAARFTPKKEKSVVQKGMSGLGQLRGEY